MKRRIPEELGNRMEKTVISARIPVIFASSLTVYEMKVEIRLQWKKRKHVPSLRMKLSLGLDAGLSCVRSGMRCGMHFGMHFGMHYGIRYRMQSGMHFGTRSGTRSEMYFGHE